MKYYYMTNYISARFNHWLLSPWPGRNSVQIFCGVTAHKAADFGASCDNRLYICLLRPSSVGELSYLREKPAGAFEYRTRDLWSLSRALCRTDILFPVFCIITP